MRPLVLAVWILVGTGCDQASSGGNIGAVDGSTDLSGCTTSCDCAPGQTCAGGSCIVGVIAVYCCSDENCPADAVCQAPNGEVSVCHRANGSSSR